MLFEKTRRKIDFVIAGTQKGGTSALDSYLRMHPEIGMGERKELHFFDNEKIFSKPKIDYSQYERLFDFTSKRKIFGEATPIYMYWKPSCKRIWEYNPEIKLIFILRNPIARAFSNWNMQYDRKSETKDFSYCIRNEEQRVKETFSYQHRVFSYIDRGFYSTQIRRFKQYFDEEQLLFIKYEEFNTNQENVLNEVFNFLGVNPDNFLFERKTVHKRNKHSSMSTEDKKYLIDKFKNEIYQVEKLLKWNCSDWLE